MLFEQVAATLAAHDAIEREIFYPACKELLGEDDDTLMESLAEHGLVEFCIYKAMIASEEELPSMVKVLEEVVQHHVEEEHETVVPAPRRQSVRPKCFLILATPSATASTAA